MSFLVIPNEVTSREAVIWIGIINEPVNPAVLNLTCNNASFELEENWINFNTASGRNTVTYQYFTIQDLEPGNEYRLDLQTDNESLSTGSFRTLPESLPSLNEQPFTVLLGSCFCSSRAGSSAIGSAYLKLREREKIDLKILCGDQVYLDDPALHFLFHTHTFEDLEEILLANYVRTWTQGSTGSATEFGAGPGYQHFLQNGANFFSSDDHEYWNNAPNRTTLIRDSWFPNGRYNWMKIAKSLLEIFQSRKSKTIFNVGSLSFFVADTRVNRDAGRMSFMSAADLSALDNWITNLQDVGVLVVGQPVFSKKSGFIAGNFGDWNLPDYAQYEDFVRIINKAVHSVVILTGDVHFGRVAYCQLKPGVFLYEIISSPTALVDQRVGGKWEAAPDNFPAFAVPGMASKPIINNYDFQLTDNHFLLLNFYRDGKKTKVILKACQIFGGGKNIAPLKIAEFNLS